MKVLIVDPDWRFAEQASNSLEAHAHLTVHQPDADQAVETAQSWQPDLVILASELAQGDVLDRLTALKPRPAVLLTGWLDRYDLAWRAWQKGGDDLLIKPLLRDEELHVSMVVALENAATGERAVRRATVA